MTALSLPSGAVAWECVIPGGPALCNHVGVYLNGKIYLHGGVSQKRLTEASSSIFSLDLSEISPIWREIRSPQSPTLSHHAHFTVANRYWALVGGWNGKERSSEVFVFDSATECWLPKPTTRNFPEGGGLSSHAILPLRDNTALVVGREGGLRTQNRAGSAFLLKYNSKLNEFGYSEFPLGTHSRSSHTISQVAGYIFIIGGRDHNLIEVHSGVKPLPLDAIVPSSLASIGTNISKYGSLMSKEPPCLRSHVGMVVSKNLILVHGGETFNGRQKGAHSEIFGLTVSGRRGDWFKLNCDMPLARESHVAIVTPDNIYIHGGCTAHDQICTELYKLVLK